MQTYPNGSKTTDGRFLKIGTDDTDWWWDTTGIDIVSGDVVENHMVTHRVGIMVFAQMTRH